MKKNIGYIDKIIRIGIAIVIAFLYLTHLIEGPLAIILLILASLFILTSFINFCPLYWAFGLSTRTKHN